MDDPSATAPRPHGLVRRARGRLPDTVRATLRPGRDRWQRWRDRGCPEVELPALLASQLQDPAGDRWRRALPRHLADVARRWELELGAPVTPGGATALVLATRRADGSAAYLKVARATFEGAGEVAALRLVAGDGAVRLLEHDPHAPTFLLEAAEPGRAMSELADTEAAADVAAGLLARWWRPVPADAGIDHVRELTHRHAAQLDRWRALLASQVPDRDLDRASQWLRSVPSADDDVLLHTDLHTDNVLAATREPWLAIDPKPFVGPRGFDLEPLLRTDDLLDAPQAAVRRFDRLTERLGLDRAATGDAVLARGLVSGLFEIRHGYPIEGWGHVGLCRRIARTTSR